MTESSVSLVKVSAYVSSEIRNALVESLDLLGGLANLIDPRSKVFVKINFLSPLSSPEKAICTHPIFTMEIVRLLLELNCDVTIGDDIPSKKTDFSASGYQCIHEELGVRTVNLKEYGFRKVKLEGKHLSHTYLSSLLLASDFIINLPKLKTHSFTSYTGAIKNMYGGIPHGYRLKYHNEFRQPDLFSQMLVDIFAHKPPDLTIMDAITSMEGEGPSAGYPRNTGVIIASQDAVALDAVASYIMGYNPLAISTTLDAHERNLGMGDINSIDILGEDINTLRISDFKHSTIATGLLLRKLPQFLYAVIQQHLALTPKIIKDKCTACEECIQVCPVEAIQLVNDTYMVDKKLCIHCMCCHEVCRYRAIRLKRRPIGIVIKYLESFYTKLKDLFSSTR